MNTETPSDAWNRFTRAWEVLREQWDDQIAYEVERRWTDNWGSVIANYDSLLREAEAFTREVERLTDGDL